MQNQGASAQELLALLLLALPSVLTRQKLLLLPELAERVHALTAAGVSPCRTALVQKYTQL